MYSISLTKHTGGSRKLREKRGENHRRVYDEKKEKEEREVLLAILSSKKHTVKWRKLETWRCKISTFILRLIKQYGHIGIDV